MATILQQGWFTSTGNFKRLAIRSDVDWIKSYNQDVWTANIGGGGPFSASGYWQRDMPQGQGLNTFKTASNALQALGFAANTGYTLIDTSLNLPRTAVATTALSNVVRPIVATGSTAGLSAGTVVRLFGVAEDPNLMGIDFTIDTIVANTSFRLANGLANVPGAVGTAGFYRVIAYDPMYYPSTRQILNVVSAGVTTVITCSVSPNYTVGQVVRLLVPSAYGMVELDGLQGTIIAQNAAAGTGTITVDIDSSTFTPFVFPLPAAVPFGPAMVVPVGEVANTAISDPNLLDDATRNVTYIGIQLAAGDNSPAGTVGQKIFWVSGKTEQNQQDPLLP